VYHSDRGAAYTSLAFSQRVRELELDQSFGSTGDCYDNAAVEAFWATLNANSAGSTTQQPGRTEPSFALHASTTSKASTTRIALQRRLGHQSPADYEQHSAA
jgi:putative transposase